MKAAYIAYDRSTLETQKLLSNYFEKIDYFILDLQQETLDVDFDQIPILADNYCIPFDEKFKTTAHHFFQKKIKPEFNSLKQETLGLCKSKNIKSEELSRAEIHVECQVSIYPLGIVKDIFFNSKTNQVFIEKDKVGVGDYQMIFIENHQLLAQNLKLSSKNIFKTEPINSHIWYTIQFEFELAKPREANFNFNHFFLVNDTDSKTVIDNWYFCQIENQIMSVHQWVPYNQYKNSDYQNFLIERVEKNIRQKFEFIQFTKVSKSYVSTTFGFLKNKSVVKNKKSSMLLPAFNFWSKDKMEQYVFSKVDQKLKKMIKQEVALVAQKQQKGVR